MLAIFCTTVVTNEYKLHYVESGNHAEVHVTEERIRSIRNYLMIRPFIKVADAIANTGNVIDRKLNGIDKLDYLSDNATLDTDVDSDRR